MSFNPLILLHERQCAGIYDDLDCGRPAKAVKQCEELLRRDPHIHLASALKAVALCRTARHDEANAVVDKLIQLRGDALVSALTPLTMALSLLDRDGDEVEVLDVLSKAQPGSLNYATKACLAMARTRQWQRMQQTALRAHKISSSASGSAIGGKKNVVETDLYFWWSMQAYCLLADDSTAAGAQLALPLSARMIAKQLESKPFGAQSDEIVYLYARILQKQGKSAWPEALRLLSDDETGKALCQRSMTLAALRLSIQQQAGRWQEVHTEAVQAMDAGNRNWAVVEVAVQSAVALAEASGKPAAVKQLEEKLTKLAREHNRDRTTRLTPLLLMRSVHGCSTLNTDLSGNLLKLATTYLDDFGSKGCAFEDLQPIMPILSQQERETFLQKLERQSRIPDAPFATLDSLCMVMNAVKLRRALQQKAHVTAQSEWEEALVDLRLYLLALPLGKGLPDTEMQPADDFALLAVQSLLHASKLQRCSEQGQEWRTSLYLASAILHAGLKRSPKGYRLRVVLMRLLLQFGAVDAAQKHFDALGVKGVQFDTLGWLLASRSAYSMLMLEPESEAERTFLSTLRRMRSVWQESQTQVPAMVAKALEHGTFSRVEEMLQFGARLDGSIARRLHALEAAQLQSLGVSVGGPAGQVRKDVGEAAKALQQPDSTLFDQRDRGVLLNFMPADFGVDVVSLTATTTFGEPDDAYVRASLAVCASTFDLPACKKLDAIAIDALSQDVRTLYALTLRLPQPDDESHDSTSSLAEAAQEAFAEFALRVQQPHEPPSASLYNACAALEAHALLQHYGDAANDAAKKGLQDVREALIAAVQQQTSAVSTSSDIPQAWQDVLRSMQPATLVKDYVKELESGTLSATKAVLARIEAALS